MKFTPAGWYFSFAVLPGGGPWCIRASNLFHYITETSSPSALVLMEQISGVTFWDIWGHDSIGGTELTFLWDRNSISFLDGDVIMGLPLPPISSSWAILSPLKILIKQILNKANFILCCYLWLTKMWLLSKIILSRLRFYSGWRVPYMISK